MIKSLTRFFKRSGPTVLRGAGSAAVAALGWKIASDVYDAVKKRLQNKDAPASQGPTEPGQ